MILSLYIKQKFLVLSPVVHYRELKFRIRWLFQPEEILETAEHTFPFTDETLWPGEAREHC